MLRAVNAVNPTQELWNSQQNAARDSTGYFAKFTPPVVVNGKVYMASFSDYVNPTYLNVFGLLKASKQFTLSTNLTKISVRPGSSAAVQVTVNPQPGYYFAGTVVFSAQGLPAGATAAFNPPTVTGPGSTTMTITTTAATALGTTAIAVTGTSKSGITSSIPLQLHVTNTAFAFGLNFVGNGASLNPTDMAGVIPKPNWNNLPGAASGSPQALADETGSVTAATAVWIADNPWALPIAATPVNFTMMQGYLDTANENTTTVTVAGLPATPNGYDVYVYADGDNGSASRSGNYSISGPGVTAQTLLLTDAANANFSGTFTQVTATNANGNYLVFQAPGPGFTITAAPYQSNDNTLRAPVNGIQIVPR
jgi:hypothetical protein